MVVNFRKLLIILSLCFVSLGAIAQTGGSSDLSSIESKAKQITQNDEKAADLNRIHFQTFALEQDKLKKLNSELAALIAEKDAVLDEYKRGQFCTGCNTPRSQFKPGENFPHSGQSVRAATEQELASKAKEYDLKISAKEAELEKFEGQENEFTRKRADLSKQADNLKASSDKLREEIVALSKSYRDKVIAHGKATQRNWISDLMFVVANKHILEDKIDILNVKLADLDKDEASAILASNQKVSEQNEADIQKLKNTIGQLNGVLADAKTTYQEKLANLIQESTSLKARLDQIDRELAKSGLLQQDIDKLKANRDSIVAELEQNNKNLSNLESSHQAQVSKVEEDVRTSNDKIWQLTTDLSKRQEAALESIKKGFVIKRNALNEALIARRAHLQTTGDLLLTKKADYRKRFLEFADLVDKERVRLVNACNISGASCFGIDTHGTVVGNWNTASGCVGQMESNRSIGTYYGCEEEASIYKSHYASHLNGLSDDDLAALKRNDSKTKYDLILRKVID